MKYLKKFENTHTPWIIPNNGDFVVIEFKYDDSVWDDYINNSIGSNLKINNNINSYTAKYYITDEIYEECFDENDEDDINLIKKDEKGKYIIMMFTIENILFSSQKREDCENFLVAKKYNL